MQRRRQSGFTFVELAIVLTVLAVLATLAVPRMIIDRVTVNETRAVEHLKEIAFGQLRFRAMSLIDRDKDQRYEFGTLQELAGHDVLRDFDQRLRRSILDHEYGEVGESGFLELDGYLFALYLPDPSGAGVFATAEHAKVLVDANAAEEAFSVVAWPIRRGETGRNTFFIDARGDVRRSTRGGYSGTEKVPGPGCALVGRYADRILNQKLVEPGKKANDGKHWFGWP